MIETLFPLPVTAASELFGDVPEGSGLHPEERALVAGVGAGRRREFTTVRHCARAALKSLGAAPGPLLPDEWGAPRWPPGIVGSMTHCRGYRAAVVARHGDVRALGIDAEPHRPLRDGVLTAVALSDEQDEVAALLHRAPAVRWDRLLFCAKEAAFKAWFPQGVRRGGARPNGFHDIKVTFGGSGGTFRAVVLPGLPEATSLEGRWLASPELLLAAAVRPGRPVG
ncbi:4'-phosphopantetheinyl transferase Npt [Streptomyces hundungensis]|uniref:4'-phosphopantetheinyl transferase Npt n=1 Tax=Streptomyces hundungensis TaxID=1077946 RepID=A0A387HBD7_9ACTN|nr:4'-phosphopantetheinyl transferase superfamily protein [Streptomyces hundungensis]AYG80729.1 4'-phosphopantetheinyl transferase Npt [Streptomyces hundungensis]